MPYPIDHIHVKSQDPDASASWFQEAFGFEIVESRTRNQGDRFVRMRDSKGLPFTVSGARPGEKLSPASAEVHWGLEHFGVLVEDLDAEIERLTGMGAELKEGPIDQTAEGYPIVAFMAVPGGIRVELVMWPKSD